VDIETQRVKLTSERWAILLNLSFLSSLPYLHLWVRLSMSIFEAAPNEILAEIIARMTLKSCARCVYHRLRDGSLLMMVDPTLNALDELYLTAISSPALLAAEDYISTRLVPFDREAYLATLCAQHT
jgi:hypothetical protein